jgi:hypothetical protein
MRHRAYRTVVYTIGSQPQVTTQDTIVSVRCKVQKDDQD